jgi:hypothetical protein
MPRSDDSAIVTTLASGALLLFSGYYLFTVSISFWPLSFLYLLYAISWMVFLHSFFFHWAAARAQSGKRLSKSFPKYLEYGYTLVVSVSLMQIFFFSPRVADYVAWSYGDEQHLIASIKNTAKTYVEDDCKTKGTKTVSRWFRVPLEYAYTPEYCAKLQRIVDANDPADYVLTAVLPDREFLDHAIEEQVNTDATSYTYSPIRDYVTRLKILRELKSQGTSHDSRLANALAWIGLLLLPLGLALRLVKTSLEIFADLE